MGLVSTSNLPSLERTLMRYQWQDFGICLLATLRSLHKYCTISSEPANSKARTELNG